MNNRVNKLEKETIERVNKKELDTDALVENLKSKHFDMVNEIMEKAEAVVCSVKTRI